MKNNLKVVLDTNVLLVSISSKSKHHWIFEKLLANEFELTITNEILLEYEEVISNKFNKLVARNIVKALLILPNVKQIPIYFNWDLITEDKDDNKFVDCALNSNSSLIVTQDNHFNILEEIDFPNIRTVNIAEFKSLIEIDK